MEFVRQHRNERVDVQSSIDQLRNLLEGPILPVVESSDED